MEKWYDYWTGTRTTYRGRGLPMNIGKSNNNFKYKKPKCFDCKIYGHIAKDCKQLKQEWDTRKCYKCRQTEHIAKDCRNKQKMKNQSIQENTEGEKDNKKKSFGEDPE